MSGVDGELAVVDGGQQCPVLAQGTEGTYAAAAPLPGLFQALEQFVQGGGVIVSGRSACAGNFGYGVLAGGCFTTGQELRSQLRLMSHADVTCTV